MESLDLLLCDRIKTKETEGTSVFKSSASFDAIQKAIDEYYVSAFSPEIIHALNFVEKTKYSAELMSQYFKAIGENIKEGSFTHSKFQTNLLYIQNHFEKAIGRVRGELDTEILRHHKKSESLVRKGGRKMKDMLRFGR